MSNKSCIDLPQSCSISLPLIHSPPLPRMVSTLRKPKGLSFNPSSLPANYWSTFLMPAGVLISSPHASSSAESSRSASGSLQEALAYSSFTLLCKGTTGGTLWSCCRTCRSEHNGRERFGQCSQHILVKSCGTIVSESADNHRSSGLLPESLRENRSGYLSVTRLGSVVDFVAVCVG